VCLDLFMGWCSVLMWTPLNRLFVMRELFLLIWGGKRRSTEACRS
jgi:hypothetical protein